MDKEAMKKRVESRNETQKDEEERTESVQRNYYRI